VRRMLERQKSESTYANVRVCPRYFTRRHAHDVTVMNAFQTRKIPKRADE